MCMEFWKYVFSKQVDNLRTNNAGTFILIDDHFKFIGRVSNHDHESQEYKDKVKCYETFVIGLLKGALINIGFDSSIGVHTSITNMRIEVTVSVAPVVGN